MISDGWHKVGAGDQVFTENGIILSAVKVDHNGSLVPACIYRTNNKTGGSDRKDHVKYSTFKRSNLYFVS